MASELGLVRTVASCALLAVALGACAIRPAPEARGVARLGDEDLGLGDVRPYERGKALLRQGRPALALSYLRRALVEEGRTTGVLNAVAVAYAETRREDLSLQYFQEALASDPRNVAVLNNIGFAALRQGNVAMAELYLARADAVDEEEPIVAANLRLLDQLRTRGPARTLAAQPAPEEPVSLTRVVRLSRYVQRLETAAGADTGEEPLPRATVDMAV